MNTDEMIAWLKRFLPMWIDTCERMERTLSNDELFIASDET